MQPEDLLREYADVCEKNREKYGDFLSALQRAGMLFEILSGVQLSRAQVAQFMLCWKLARESYKHGKDNCGDACAYLGAIVAAEEYDLHLAEMFCKDMPKEAGA